MARIKMPAARSKAQEITFEEAFNIFLTDSAARGLAEKTLKTYRIRKYVAGRRRITCFVTSAADSSQRAPCVRASHATTRAEVSRRRERIFSVILLPASI